MKRYIPYISAVLLLGIAIGWFFCNQSPGTINEREGNFAVKDASEIQKVVLSETDHPPMTLTKNSSGWVIDGKYAAREDLVAQLMESIERVSSLCPVPSAAHDNVIREMLSHHIRVEIYDKEDDLIKSYWVGGPSVDGQSTYMLLEEKGSPVSRPHMTYMPGFKGYLSLRYKPETENWRSRKLFDYQLSDIKSLSVEYPFEQQKSFVISRVSSEDSFSVEPLLENFKIDEPYLQKYVKQYIGFYKKIYIETYDNMSPVKDSILQTPPFCIIKVTDMANHSNEAKLFFMQLNKRSKTEVDAQGNELTHDIDHYYASVNDNQDFAIVQYYVFGNLLRSYKDFFYKPQSL